MEEYSECDVCGKDIYVGEKYYNLRGEHVHLDCIKSYLDIAEK